MEYLEILSQISLTEEEKQETAGELKKILAYMEKLEELDTDGVEPMSHVFPVQNVFREDIVEREDQWEALLENAPQKKEGQSGAEDSIEEEWYGRRISDMDGRGACPKDSKRGDPPIGGCGSFPVTDRKDGTADWSIPAD